MILFDRDTIKIKNINRPNKISVKLCSGIDSYYVKNNVIEISLLPYEYMEGGRLSTGSVIYDIMNYVSNILDTIKENCYFSSKNDDGYISRYHKYLNKRNIDNECKENIKNKITKSFKETLFDHNFIEELNNNECFSVFIRNFDSDIETVGNIGGLSSFILLFGDVRKTSKSIFEINDNTKLKIRNNYYDLVFETYDFINILIRIFSYCLIQETRNNIIGSVAFRYTQHDDYFSSVLLWDDIIKKYHSFNDWSHDNKKTKFNIKLLCDIKTNDIDNNDITLTNELDNIVFNNIFYNDSCDSSIMISKPFFVNSRRESIFEYIATQKIKNKDEVIMLKIFGQNNNEKDIGYMKTNFINHLIYNHKINLYYCFIKDFIDSKLNFKITYDDILVNKPMSNLIADNTINIKFMMYYCNSKTSKKVLYDDFKSKRILKYVQEAIYNCLNALCNEMDLNTNDIIDNTDIDFLKRRCE